MTPEITVTLVTYALLVLTIGLVSTRRSGRSSEEYFMAGRTLGALVLFMALFGTNCTAFLLVGIPGQAYHDGLGTFSVNVPIIALGIPMTFWAIGVPALRAARRLNALTSAELYSKQLNSRAVGVLLFSMYTLYTVPYMITTVKGAAITFAGMTGVSQWIASFCLLAVALIYTAGGGMRGTAWTNVLQGTVFILFMATALIVVAQQLGGFTEAMQRIPKDKLSIGEGRFFTPGGWSSWGLAITFTVIGFPHMLARLMAAKNERTIQSSCRLYPLAMAVLWLPAVLLGAWGAVEFPGLVGRESDVIYSKMIQHTMPAWLGAVGLLAVLAASMSTLDAMILTLSSMLVRDVLPASALAEARARDKHFGVHAGRAFAAGIALVVFLLVITWGQSKSVFNIARLAFYGYVTLTPTLFLGLRWQRFTKQGAFASILGSNLLLAVLHFAELEPFGYLSVFWAFLAAIGLGLGVSLLTPQRNAAIT